MIIRVHTDSAVSVVLSSSLTLLLDQAILKYIYEKSIILLRSVNFPSCLLHSHIAFFWEHGPRCCLAPYSLALSQHYPFI
jgi:hypothetical protein